MGSVVAVAAEPVVEGLGSGFFVVPGLLVDPSWFEGLAATFHISVLLGVAGFSPRSGSQSRKRRNPLP